MKGKRWYAERAARSLKPQTAIAQLTHKAGQVVREKRAPRDVARRAAVVQTVAREFIFVSALALFPILMYAAIPLTFANSRTYRSLTDSGDLFLFAVFLLAVGIREALQSSLVDPRNLLARTLVTSLSFILLLLSTSLWVTGLTSNASRRSVYGVLGWTAFGVSLCLFVAAATLRAITEVAEQEAAVEAGDRRLQASLERTISSTLGLDQGPSFDGFAALAIGDQPVDHDDFVFQMKKGDRRTLRVTISDSLTESAPGSRRPVRFDGRSASGPVEFRLIPESDGLCFDPDTASVNVSADRARDVDFVMTAIGEPASEHSVLVSVLQSNRLGAALRTTCRIEPPP